MIFSCRFVNKYLIWGRKIGGGTDILRNFAYQDWIWHVGVTMIRWPIFFWQSSLEHDLTSWMKEKRNRISRPKDARTHLVLYSPGLVSKQSTNEVGVRAWMQKDLELAVACVLQTLGKQKYLVSILNCPWCFVISALHVHSENWECTLQTLQFICWKGDFKWTCGWARILCCVYPPFSKD